MEYPRPFAVGLVETYTLILCFRPELGRFVSEGVANASRSAEADAK